MRRRTLISTRRNNWKESISGFRLKSVSFFSTCSNILTCSDGSFRCSKMSLMGVCSPHLSKSSPSGGGSANFRNTWSERVACILPQDCTGRHWPKIKFETVGNAKSFLPGNKKMQPPLAGFRNYLRGSWNLEPTWIRAGYLARRRLAHLLVGLGARKSHRNPVHQLNPLAILQHRLRIQRRILLASQWLDAPNTSVLVSRFWARLLGASKQPIKGGLDCR